MLLSSLSDSVITVNDPLVSFALNGGGAVEEFYAVGRLWADDGSWQYTPAGLWDIQVAMVDRTNKIGAWSSPLTLDLPLGWLLIGWNYNIPKHKDRAALIWRATRQSNNYKMWLVEGQRSEYGAFGALLSPQDTGVPYPFSSNNVRPFVLVSHTRGNASIPLQTSTILSGVDAPPVPLAWAATHKLDAKDVCWSWVTHSGETQQGPTATLANTSDSTAYGYRRLRFISGMETPEGVLGRYIYLKISGTWRRCVAKPWLADQSEVDKYLFSLDDNQPILWADPTGIEPQPAGPVPPNAAWSIVSPFQHALYTSNAAIIIDNGPDVPIYGPAIDPWLPTVKKRSITSTGLAGWNLKQVTTVPATGGKTPANTHPTYWPMYVEQCAEPQGTTIYAMTMEAGARGPGASMSLCASDYSGGQAFKPRFFDCIFSVGATSDFPWVKEGLVVDWSCSSSSVGGHTASEWLFERCSFQSIRLEGTQTVNFIFKTTHLLGSITETIVLDGSNAIFIDGLYGTRAESLLGIGWSASCIIDDMFIDQEHNISLVDYNSYSHKRVDISRSLTRGFAFISRAPCTKEHHELFLRDWLSYAINNDNSVIYETSLKTIDLNLTNSTPIENASKIYQPDATEFYTRTGTSPSQITTPPTIPPVSPGGT